MLRPHSAPVRSVCKATEPPQTAAPQAADVTLMVAHMFSRRYDTPAAAAWHREMDTREIYEHTRDGHQA